MTPSEIIVATLEQLIKNSKGQYIKNVLEIAQSGHNWSEQEFQTHLNDAIVEGVVIATRFRDIPSLGIASKESTQVTITDNAFDMETQTMPQQQLLSAEH